MKEMQECIRELEQMFNEINIKWYEGQLEMPVITLAKGRSNSLGHFTTWKAWTDGEEKKHEINISCEYTHRPLKETITTMMHEMVHLYNHVNEIDDTSRNGTYHNKNFKTEAEKRGLKIEHHETYGWTITTLNEEGEKWVTENFEESEKLIYRTEGYIRPTGKSGNGNTGNGNEPTGTEGTPKKKSNIMKHVCPKCGNIARTSKKFLLICGECVKKDAETGDYKKEGYKFPMMEIVEN